MTAEEQKVLKQLADKHLEASTAEVALHQARLDYHAEAIAPASGAAGPLPAAGQFAAVSENRINKPKTGSRLLSR